jgi:transcription elongation factor Elf1
MDYYSCHSCNTVEIVAVHGKPTSIGGYEKVCEICAIQIECELDDGTLNNHQQLVTTNQKQHTCMLKLNGVTQ